jgi:hypothetical protein
MTPAQTAALGKLTRDGVIFAGYGVSLATARVLASLGHGALNVRIRGRGFGLFGRGRRRTATHIDWSLRCRPEG